MRRIALIVGLALVLIACTDAIVEEVPGTPTFPIDAEDLTVGSIPPQLVDHDIRDVTVGDRTLTLAIADSPTLRATGLMHVTDLASLDGMLFYWRHTAHEGFWMKDTVIPLDIVWFDADGRFVGRASMVPCEVEDCPTYAPEGDPDYRYGIEARPGDLDWVSDDTVIVYSD